METIETLKPAFHRVIENPELGLRGFVVVDNFLGGSGNGGIRMSEDLSLDEIASLAREMTLKYAWLNVARGGAKAGIIAPADVSRERRRQLCVAFGEAISDLVQERKFFPGQDLGTGPDDLETILKTARATPRKDNAQLDSNYYTAMTVFTTLDVLLYSRGRRLPGATVLIEGFGKVASHLAGLLSEAGARIVGVSTACGAVYDPAGLDPALLVDLKAKYQDACVQHVPAALRLPREQLLLQEADLLVPGARPDSIHAHNVAAIRARFIVPIANIPADTDVELQLFDRGIHYVPGFVANCGGIFCWVLSRLTESARKDTIRSGFARKVERLIARADRTRMSIPAIARRDALSNLARMAAEERGGIRARLSGLKRKLAAKRVGYVVGKRLFGRDWSNRATRLSHWYFDSKHFG